MPRIIGLISGTSVDGVDAVLTEVTGTTLDLRVQVVAGQTYPYPPLLRERILAACAGEALSPEAIADLDDAIAQVFAEAAIAIGQSQDQNQAQSQDQNQAELIGSHGQTIFHRPRGQSASGLGYSLQLGRGAVIEAITGIPTISNFRVADIAAGGEGAPLVPPVDIYLLGDEQEYRCVQNIGGIGNLTYLPPRNLPDWQSQVRGWDTGPGNSLLDLAVQRLSQGQRRYDAGGAWAAQGQPCMALVEQWLTHPYFAQQPPKSTGRELFGWGYLEQCFQAAAAFDLTDADLLASLTELTAASIAQNYRAFLPHPPARVLVCGGGSHNHYLCDRLRVWLEPAVISTTTELGVNADFKEAIAFAVLAHWYQQGIPGNWPAVTGAKSPMLLGERPQAVKNGSF